ncbi:MAG: MFS transporter [Snowella sp.]|nr:MFS transporter [Snowella sp.]
MILTITIALNFGSSQSWAAILPPNSVIGQVPLTGTAIIFSSFNILLALIAGVVMAFAFQLLFTNLAIAVVSAPGDTHSYREERDDHESESLGETIRGLETKVGVALLISVSIALFIACFLAVRLSLVGTPLLGAITGVIIWALFFILMTWFSSSALGSLLGSIISTATSGIQNLLGTGSSLVGASLARSQAVSTAEEITAAVRRELTAGLDADSIRSTLQNSLDKLQFPKFDLNQLGKQFEKILRDANLGAIADNDALKHINRETFVNLISSRTDLSKQEVNQIADQLDSAWKRVLSSNQQLNPQDLIQQLKSAAPQDLRSGKLGEQLTELAKTATNRLQSQPSQTAKPNAITQTLQLGTAAVLSQVLDNVNLSDLDVEKIGGQLRTLSDNLLHGNGKSHGNGQANGYSNGQAARTAKPFSVIQADLENYLLFSPPWKLNRETVQAEFREVLYDAGANPSIIRQELELINRDYLVRVLSLREDFSPQGVQELANYLDHIRSEVFSTVKVAELTAKAEALENRIEAYLRFSNKEDLRPAAIARDFPSLLEDPDASFEELNGRLQQLDRNILGQTLMERQDMDGEEVSQILNQLESLRDQVLSQAETSQQQAQQQAQALFHQVADYLRNTHRDELNPEGIQRDFQTLFADPEAGMQALRSRLSQFDRETLVQLLNQRQDLSEAQINQILDQIESVRHNLLHAPQEVTGKAKEQYDHLMQAIADYLRNTNLEELNPEGIQHDLSMLLNHPKVGAAALQDRLSQIDRETWVKLLSQRSDLTEEQVNRAIDQIQTAIRNIVKAPRRLASRAQQQVVSFEANLESYLRNTQKEELNPEGIKRDLQLLLRDPRAGLSSLGDRVSHFDRGTFVALLSQRPDLTEAEANRIADQVESTFKGIVGQFQQAQHTIQTAIDNVFANIRSYLNSLHRPELNYDGIKHDFRLLFNDPKLGLEALRDRLSHFDRGTLVALLSSREDLSEADANRIIGQVEEARDSVLHQFERVQDEAQRRINSVKRQTQKQVRETRKAASVAAWWVFGSALASLVASILAGILAVGFILV